MRPFFFSSAIVSAAFASDGSYVSGYEDYYSDYGDEYSELDDASYDDSYEDSSGYDESENPVPDDSADSMDTYNEESDPDSYNIYLQIYQEEEIGNIFIKNIIRSRNNDNYQKCCYWSLDELINCFTE